MKSSGEETGTGWEKTLGLGTTVAEVTADKKAG